jgi:hypothetical protein
MVIGRTWIVAAVAAIAFVSLAQAHGNSLSFLCACL